MDTTQATEDLIRDGFAKVKGILDADDVRALQTSVRGFLERELTPYSAYQEHKRSPEWRFVTYVDRNWTVVNGAIGQSPAFDAVLEKVITHPAIKGVLEAVLGAGYKMWQANVRRAEPGGDGQALHQDAIGELGISVLVNDHPTNDGCTAFLPGSHRWPIRYGDIGLPLWPKHLAPALAAADGKAGDVALFFNRTWHGRFAGTHPGTAILMSFFPVGATFPIQRVPAEVLAKLPPDLRTRFDPDQGITMLADGRALVGNLGDRPPPRRAETNGVLLGEVPMPRRSPFLIVKGWARMKNTIRPVVRRFRPAS